MGYRPDYRSSWLRQHLQHDEVLRRIATLIESRGLDPQQLVLADYFPDDTSFMFGIVVTPEHKVFQFGYDYLHRDISAGELAEWEDLSQTWKDSPYDEQIANAFEFLAGRRA